MNLIFVEVSARNPRSFDMLAGPRTAVPASNDLTMVSNVPLGQQPPQDRYVRNVGGGLPATAMVRGVMFFLAELNNFALNREIERSIREQGRLALQMMANHRTGGILAVAEVIVTYDFSNTFRVRGTLAHPDVAGGVPYRYDRPAKEYGPETRRLGWPIWLENGVYAQPAHAIAVYRNNQRRRGEIRTGVSDPEFKEHRFFWGVWEGVYQPR